MKTKPVFLSLALLLATLGSIASEVSSKANDEPTTPIVFKDIMYRYFYVFL